MTEEEYLEMVVEDHNNSVALEKEMQGQYTIEEIIQAMDTILNG